MCCQIITKFPNVLNVNSSSYKLGNYNSWRKFCLYKRNTEKIHLFLVFCLYLHNQELLVAVITYNIHNSGFRWFDRKINRQGYIYSVLISVIIINRLYFESNQSHTGLSPFKANFDLNAAIHCATAPPA